jgi:mannose-6-phosphate isomerase-like protein (cupin superfamily)
VTAALSIGHFAHDREERSVGVRRVVTGRNDAGKSIFVSDEPVEPVTVELMPGLAFSNLWGGDDAPTLPTDGTPPAARTYFPPAGGYRFSVVTLPPEGSTSLPADLDVKQALAQVNDRLPGMMDHMEPDTPGMHTTDTVDLDFVLAGDLYLELDDGAEVHLKTGDCVIQNGTRHAWHNRSPTPCTMLSILVGGRRSS